MDTFGWTHAPHVQSASSSRHDDMARPASECYVPMPAGTSAFDLDDAFFGVGFGVQCDGGGGGDAVSSSFNSDLNPSSSQLSLLDCQDAMDLPGGESVLLSSGDMIPSIGRPHDDGLLLDAFVLPKNENGAAVSNPIFSSYSSTTGGNVSSGDSNNHGGHDMEVASPCTIAPSLAQTAQLHSKRKLEYPTITTTATTAKTVERPSAKRRAAAATSITFGRSQELNVGGYEPDREAMAQVKEMMYRAAAMRPVNLGEETAAVAAEKPRRKNVRISSDPQTVAARLRRERVSERLRVLQRLVPGGSKMDTASMLDEAASYLKFLQAQVKALETLGPSSSHGSHGRFQLQHYSNAPSVLAFGRDVNGYVKSNRNMQL